MRTYDALVIGAGFAGVGTAVRLKEAGVTDVAVLERSDRPGGTWRDNTYPGAACDIPSLLYSYSWARNPRWSLGYSGGPEILSYLEDIVERYGLGPLIHYGQDVSELRFDDEAGRWTATSRAGGQFVARSVVMAPGPLSNASFPAMLGIDTYTGHKIHSARWDHRYVMTGKRVAVIGTGASAVQIVPELVKTAERVKVFQRTPGWVLPRVNLRQPVSLFAAVPAAQDAARTALFWGHEAMALGLVWNSALTSLVEQAGRLHLRSQVRDPWLRRQLTPNHRPGCKRMLVSSDWYPALQADNCDLITWPIARLSPDGIRTADGLEHQVDAIVFATGFHVAKTGSPIPVIGTGGRSLDNEWQQGAKAYKSVSVTGFPNLFLTFGPNSGPGHNSALVYMESQIDYAVAGIKEILSRNLRCLDVKPDIQERYNEQLQSRLTRTNWNSGCSSWYLTEDGFNATMYPGFATQYARQLRRLHLEDYETQSA